MLTEMFEKERKNYEKTKKAKKKSDDETGGGSGSQTAHTGNLEALIDQGRDELPPTGLDETIKGRAEDAMRDEDDVEEEKPKKKKKKAAAKETESD